METANRPLLDLYVTGHPSYQPGRELAELIKTHFSGDRHQAVVGTGINVFFHHAPTLGDSNLPLLVDYDRAQITAIVALANSTLAADPAGRDYIKQLSSATQAKGLRARLFPVIMERVDNDLPFGEQALRWDKWEGSNEQKEQRLIRELTHELCRLLRHRLNRQGESKPGETLATDYPERVQLFISHSKHDRDGEAIAKKIRDWLHEYSSASSFFDTHDIPAGVRFEDVFSEEIAKGAIMALHTDSYSSREWCRREIIEAKRRHVPMIVVSCLRDLDLCAMPHLGNVPMVRVSPSQPGERIGVAVGHLLDEVFLDYAWRCRVRQYQETHPEVLFLYRPPELISLANWPNVQKESCKIVYPGPRMHREDTRLFQQIAPGAAVQPLAAWLEDIQ